MRFVYRQSDLAVLLWPASATLMLLLAWVGLRGPFVFDDIPNLERLRLISGHLSWANVGTYLANFHGNPGRPLSTITFLLNDVAWPSTPDSFKYTNLMLHAFGGLMAFGLVRSITHAYLQSTGNIEDKRVLWLALLASALWMLHPMQVSAVFLVVQRMAILSAIFVMGGLWCYVALLTRARHGRDVFLALAALAGFTVLAFLCKENGALAPMYAWTLHATVLRPLLIGPTTIAHRYLLARWAIPLAAVLPFAALFAAPDRWLDFSNRDYSSFERLITQPRVLIDYLQAVLMPRLAGGGSVFHDDYVFSAGWLSPPFTLVAALLLAGLLAFGFASRRRWPWASLAVLWFLAGHSVESTFVSLELYFEHRNYAPLLGIAMGVAHGVVYSAPRWRMIAWTTVLALLGIAGFVTHAQARVWGDERLMAAVWAREHPSSSRATQLLAKVRFDKGDVEGARTVFAQAVESGQGNKNAELYLLLLDCYLRVDTAQNQLPRASRELRTQLADFGTVGLMTQLRELAATGQCPGLGLEQWLSLSEAMLANPRRHSLQFIHHERARVFQTQRNLDRTIAELALAYTHDPTPERANLTAAVLASAGLFDQAREWAIKARDTPIPVFKAWASDRDRHATELIRAIDRAKALNSKPASAPKPSPRTEKMHPQSK